MIQHVLEPRYKKAILELVVQLPLDKPQRINTMVFCQRHNVDNRFFEALEELGAIKNKGEAGIGIYGYVRTGKLLGLNAADVLIKLGKVSVVPVAEAKPAAAKAEKKAKPVIEFFDPADNVPAEEPANKYTVVDLPSSASEVLDKLEEAVSKSAGVTVVETDKVKAMREVGQRERESFAKAVKETHHVFDYGGRPSEVMAKFEEAICKATGGPNPTFEQTEPAKELQSGCKGNCKGPATYHDLSETKGIDPLLIFGKPDTAEQPVPPCGYTPRPSTYDNGWRGSDWLKEQTSSAGTANALIPMFEREGDAVRYCADVIIAHADFVPHDIAFALDRLRDELVARLTQKADGFRKELEKHDKLIDQLCSTTYVQA